MRSKWRTAALAVMLALGALLGAHAAGAQPVRTEAGLVDGVREDGLAVYKGVPYAAAPVGALRWREPQPPSAWTGVRRTEAFAPACMQKGVSMPGETPPQVSEDCLYLNIWAPDARPDAPPGERLPVMVWIPGGGFTNGSASMPLYWGDRLARRGVIVVTLAYRLGPFGFLAHPELTRESPHNSSGDYGLMDQIAALKWVRHNIGAFGGDPERVTIMGQSAGATSVSLLMASPEAKGLFQRAVGESGGGFEPMQLAPDWLLPNAEKVGQAWASSLGAQSIEDLRRLPADKLLEGPFNSVSHPVIDRFVLPASPYAAFAEGRQNDVPILIGSNAEEARSLVDLGPLRAATYAENIRKAWGELPAALYESYPHATDAEARDARAHFERDLRFGWDVWAWARLQAATGRGKVFYYRFNQSPPFPAGSVYAGWGPSHFAELWYVFDHLDQAPSWAWTPADRRLADTMAAYWTNFARTGDPNGPGLPPWPRFKAEDGRVLQLQEPITLDGVVDLPGLKTFDAVYDQVRGAPFGKTAPR
jgi:para-nitrobenzyl esterase